MGVATRKTSPCRGDRLVLHIFGDAPVELELYYVTTMLNSIRQFRACKNLDRNPTLDRELQGNKAPSDDGANKADDTKPEVSEEPDSESSLSRRLQEDRNASRITILTLNESQQQACDGFVSDRGAAIQIVQGCVFRMMGPGSTRNHLLICPTFSPRFAALPEQVGSPFMFMVYARKALVEYLTHFAIVFRSTR